MAQSNISRGEVKPVGGRVKRLPTNDGREIATPTEAFAALAAGADGLKIFPAEMLVPNVVKAMCAVLPKQAIMIPVGGIVPEIMAEFWRAGASAFGLGSALYRPGATPAQVRASAMGFVRAAETLQSH